VLTTQISQAIRQGLSSTNVSDQLHSLGVESRPMTPAEFQQFMNEELIKWTKVAKAAGATAQ
jgi:tripartite-type tricarboxylate transporter receptor subunit TctC